jgi:hypothetical protein
LLPRANETDKRCRCPSHSEIQPGIERVVDVTKPSGHVEAVTHFSQGRFRDVQEMRALFIGAPGKSLHDVRRDRIGGPSELARECESFVWWKMVFGEFVNFDEEIVSALPGDERLMSERHGLNAEQWPCRELRDEPVRNSVCGA